MIDIKIERKMNVTEKKVERKRTSQKGDVERKRNVVGKEMSKDIENER